ncbi:dihydrolipoamide acetyltransferase family protein [Kroppenstedtia eburnea]|uniref:dihydrolipoamide acetyltransferase family protein n=1 Tax=Kroppenstedtia eburnea TaxID=714067 RepID=UPI0036351B0B
MGVKFRLPDVGEGMTEAEVVRWLVREGETVASDQPVVEIQTDKAVVELPAPVPGKVGQIPWKEGDTVAVGEVLLVIDTDNESAHRETAAASEAAPAPEAKEESPSSLHHTLVEEETASPHRRRVLAAPSTRRLARDLGVEIQQVTGTGPGGRVTKEDVRKVAASLAESHGVIRFADRVARAAKKGSPADPDDTGVSSGGETEKAGDTGTITEEPLSPTRRVIADRLLFSVTRKPHATHFDELEAEGLVAWQHRLKEETGSGASPVGYLPILLKATAVALKHHPLLNAHFDEEKMTVRRFSPIHLGVAADTPRGLLVPVIRDVDRKSILQIADELRELTEAARLGRLMPDRMKGSTFTVSNAGALGGHFATPIINPPEVAILALHPVEQRPVVRDGELVPGWRMNVSLSFDHRILDGADAIRFTQTLGSYTADPGRLLLELT